MTNDEQSVPISRLPSAVALISEDESVIAF